MTDPFAPQEHQPQPPPVPPPSGAVPPPYTDGSTPWTASSGEYPPPSSNPYPPPPSTPYGSVPPGPYGQPAPQPGTDGLSIAALITGIAQTGPIAVVLGILGLRQVNRTGRDGKGMAIAGIVLGGITTVVGAVIAAVLIIGVASGMDDGYGDDPALDRLWYACDAGDMAACDDLYNHSPLGSEYEEFGDTCGGRSSGRSACDDGRGVQDDPVVEDDAVDGYGDDAELDALWDSCEAGDMAACDDLYRESPFGSEYEEFGDTCGDRTDGLGSCEEDDTTVENGEGHTYGDNPELDALWDSCEAGDMGACDDLYMESEFGSEYEEFGGTCGGRTGGGPYCTTLDD